MAALAQKLCEAVENEDAKEVENLLKCGADPNLVLPDGIAAIHLASGKESESALRCLTIILQQGGDPNVRSIEELTPVHVAASWGCCKALTFLLRKGGNPNIQDQDGNTALELALMEKNRRCVVALQEYERKEDIHPDQICDYHNNSCEPHEIPEMSSITLLLESAYEMSPSSSTKISPFISNLKNGTTGKGADDAALASQIELPGSDSRDRSEKYDHNFAGLESPELQLNDKMTNGTSGLRTGDSESEGAVLTLENWHCKRDYSSPFYPDRSVAVGNYSATIAKSYKTHAVLSSMENNNSGNQGHKIINPILNFGSQANLAINRIGKTSVNSLLNDSSKLADSQIALEGWEGLDVTSPDHVYTYDRSNSDNDLEETLVLPKTDMTEHEGLVGQENSSSSIYTSCFGDGVTTLMENSVVSDQTELVLDIHCKSSFDSNRNQVCSENNGFVDKRTNANLCSELNVEELTAPCTNTLQERAEDMGNKELTSPMLNCKYLVLSNQNMVSDGHQREIVRTTEMLYSSQSPTLPVGDANAYESLSQDLRSRLRNLLLSAKGSGLVLEQQDNHYLPGCSGHRSESSCSSTIPITRKTNSPIGQNLKDPSSTCLNTSADTLIIESADCEIEGELDSELCDLKKKLLATKVIHPRSTQKEEKSPYFFTERTRSRLLSSKSRHINSSLFDESLEMPQRGRRLRSPDGKSGSPVPSIEVTKNSSLTGLLSMSDPALETCVATNNICLFQTPEDSRGNVSEPETTVSMSTFLTDDLSSSETEIKSTPQLKKNFRDPCIESCISESVWLTEDGDTESSGETCHEFAILGYNKLGEASSAASQTGFLLNSTLTEDTAGHFTKIPRYSFSRLSCVPKADDKGEKLTDIPDFLIEEAHLSPGGRPVKATNFEPVEYLYMDNEKGHALVERHVPCTDQSSISISDTSDETIIYDWRNYTTCNEKINKDSPACTTSRVAVELYRLSNDEIARRLRGLGEDPGQVNSKTRKLCIVLLDKRLKEQATSGPVGLSFEYSPDLSAALRTYEIPDCNHDEAALSQEFDQPDKTRKWREGVLKSSFNYLLLDPRVTRHLPSRCHTLSPHECFRTFVRAVFYVGKGKRARPYCHLYESLTHYKGSNKQPCSKVQHIVDIWRSGQGVLSLHCFQNTIPVEAYTREACMVDAIGLKMLTNQKKGVYYGQAQNWTLTRRRRLGVHMLHRAMQIFLAEGERQLRPPDIRTGS
ncbi:ankyrin repeat and LEM domain-containing protein 1 [Mantella aurantiaca]